jgi:ABC-type multidrug transport system fused ATPase/permease subunit
LLGRTRDTSVNITAMNKRLSTFLTERLRAGRLVRLSGSEDAEIRQLSLLTGKQTARLYHMHRINATIGTIMEPIAVGIALALLYFGTQYFDVSIETIGVFAIILIRLLPAVTEGIRMHNVVLSYSGSLDAVVDRLARLQATCEPNQGTVRFEGLKDRIAFENVSYVYANSEDVPTLRNVSLEIPVGKLTAIVGHSGAGKSTLIDLLPRVRQPTEGRILMDGRPLNDFTLASLRGGIAFVPQSPQIFDLPLWQQISYGKPDIDRDVVQRAARLAGAAEFIENLPDGYDTMLGESGYRLSGGERQRLDIARALARDASILILDEPTSQLDPETEQKFRATLERLRQETNLTMIIIAHRLSTIANADQIVALENGFVAGAGTHAQLLRSCDWYRKAHQASQPNAEAVLKPAKAVS